MSHLKSRKDGKEGRFSLPLITSCQSHIEPTTMAILSVSYDRKSQIRIGLVARIISVLFCAVTYDMAFSVLFYVGYGIFCAFLRRIWHFLCYFTSDMAFSVLFCRIWHFLCCFTSDMAFSIKIFPLRTIPTKCLNYSYLNHLKIIINLHLHNNSFSTSQGTLFLCITNSSLWTLCGKILAVKRENYKEHINERGEHVEILVLNKAIYVLTTSQVMNVFKSNKVPKPWQYRIKSMWCKAK
jgi:hypothetical protein